MDLTRQLAEIIITLDADLQDNPNDIHKFLEKINKGFDLVVGWKKKDTIQSVKLYLQNWQFSN